MRKTFEVANVRDMANAYARSADTTPEERLAVHYFASHILSTTGNYKGFKFVFKQKQGRVKCVRLTFQ